MHVRNRAQGLKFATKDSTGKRRGLVTRGLADLHSSTVIVCTERTHFTHSHKHPSLWSLCSRGAYVSARDCSSLIPWVNNTTHTPISLPAWSETGRTRNRVFCTGTSTNTLYLQQQPDQTSVCVNRHTLPECFTVP